MGGSPRALSSSVVMMTFPDRLFLRTWMRHPWMDGLPGLATGIENVPSPFATHCRSGVHPRRTLICPTGSWIGTPNAGSLFDSTVRMNVYGLVGLLGGDTRRNTFPYCSNP